MTHFDHLSRRDFLRLSGAAVLFTGGAGNAIGHFSQAIPHAPVYSHGRALTAVPVYAAPMSSSARVNTLWADTLLRVRRWGAHWVSIDGGFVEKRLLQPVALSTELTAPDVPGMAEVAAGSAAIRAWAAADAPLVTRIGHHGVAQITDSVERDGGHWLEVSDEHGAIGWSQAGAWSRVMEPGEASQASNRSVVIDRAERHLSALAGDQQILSAPISMNERFASGAYGVSSRQISASMRQEGLYGVPYRIAFGDGFALTGAYWHHAFGSSEEVRGADVQIAPPVARWLYSWISDNGQVIVR